VGRKSRASHLFAQVQGQQPFIKGENAGGIDTWKGFPWKDFGSKKALLIGHGKPLFVTRRGGENQRKKLCREILYPLSSAGGKAMACGQKSGKGNEERLWGLENWKKREKVTSSPKGGWSEV